MPERFTLNNKTYDIPNDKIGIFMSKYPNAVKVKPMSFFDDLATKSTEFMKMIPQVGLPMMRTGGLAVAIGDALGQKAQEKVKEVLTPEMANIAFGSKIGAGAREFLGLVARVGADPTSFIPLGSAGRGVEKGVRFARELFKAKKVITPIKQIADLRIPIFGAANKTEDALELGSRLKGSEEGISKLKFLEGKFAKEFEVAKETADFNELAIIAHKKQLYREAREVAEGTGGAAEFVAKQDKPLDVIAETKPKPLENIEQLGQSALRKHPMMESIIKKDPDMIGAKRGVSIPKEKITELAPKLSTEEAIFLDKGLNTGGAFEGRKIALSVADDISNIINKSIEGKVDPRVGELFKVRAERGKALQNLAADNEIVKKSVNDARARLKATDPEAYKKLMADVDGFIADIVGDGAEPLTKSEKILRFMGETGNIPRSLMTSADLSMGLRQGLWVATSHPKIFFKAWKKQFKMFGNENYFQAIQQEIRDRSTFKKMQKGGVDFTDLGDLVNREEPFMSNFAEKIPIIGPVVRASGRAFTGLGNRLRADLFDYLLETGDYLVKPGKKMARLEATDPKAYKKALRADYDHYLKSLGRYVNSATGRGKMPEKLESAAVMLNTIFFSPKLLASRLNMMSPVFYTKLHPTVRKEAVKSLFKFAGVATTVTQLAKMGGAEVETDPRNANFMKIKVGNTRFDVLGGFQQPIRAAAQIISGKIISSSTGKVITLGEGYKPLTRFEVGLRFLEMKESPLFSFATGLMKGTNAVGDKFDVSTEVANRFIPMVIQDMKDLYEEEGLKGIPMAVPAIFGVGVQSYGGVKTWGLDGKDYPALNKELLRLKTTMGFPSSSVSGVELDLSEYKNLKDKTGKKIASELTRLIKSSEYRQYSTEQKKQIINKYIDRWKDIIKIQTYPEKFKK